ncbi:hypothetical protein [Neorhizobium tomejilense]|uniref:hypothetical protein n=1 Tax=Neorhizobium tomejilense TaxID=2093828 RepID=UPI003ECEA649
MLLQILLTTVVVPFLFGTFIAAFAIIIPGQRRLQIALLIPLAAVAIHVLLEGMPALPPVSAKHKLPLILLGGALIFGLQAMVRRPLKIHMSTVLTVVVLGGSTWLLGKNVMMADPTKAGAAIVILLIASVALGAVVARPRAGRPGGESCLAVALLAVSLAAALNAAFGAFVGMAQIDGALAALTGGWLLVGYVRYLMGNDDALALRGAEGLAFGFVISVHVIMTALFTPKASPIALVLAVLPLAVAYFLVRGAGLGRVPRVLRPFAAGLLAALPAIISIAIAATLFDG